jgi:hypothetical protein
MEEVGWIRKFLEVFSKLKHGRLPPPWRLTCGGAGTWSWWACLSWIDRAGACVHGPAGRTHRGRGCTHRIVFKRMPLTPSPSNATCITTPSFSISWENNQKGHHIADLPHASGSDPHHVFLRDYPREVCRWLISGYQAAIYVFLT